MPLKSPPESLPMPSEHLVDTRIIPLVRSVRRHPAVCVVAALAMAGSEAAAVAQTIVYRPVVTTFAPASVPVVSNYTPSGNYAAVTAFSPPVVTALPMATVSTPIAALVPASSVAVTSYAPPAMTVVARPVTASYTPSIAPTYTTTSYSGPASEVVAAPGMATVTAGYAPVATTLAPAPVAVAAPVAVPVVPGAVAVPLYRRGPFGGLRPVRGAFWPY